MAEPRNTGENLRETVARRIAAASCALEGRVLYTRAFTKYAYPLISMGKAAVVDEQALRNVIINLPRANYNIEQLLQLIR